MALVVADRVQETSITSGTGTLTLAGALAGYQTFSTAIGNGNTTFYTIYDPNLYDWEVGIGTVGAGTLARTTVLSNSAGTTSQISFASNSKFVFCTYPAEKSINYDANGVATIGEVLGYSDTGIIGSFASTVAGYNQVIVQNKSTATNASSNLNVSNDAGTAGSNYAELGINSSTFTGSGSFNIAGASYVASASTDLTLGTYGAYNVHFVTNSSTTDAMTIYNNGGISLGTFGNPGIGNMAASKFVPGYSAITSAAGTTVLTADSNYYQNLLGSTTQTFQLPDATTLLVGTTFIFDNDSSGNLTVVDNASGPIETIPGGASGFVYLAVNSTVAGTWRRHAFLPASYDFNNTTANFGTATITNASWNGNTIGTAYGGTGLTTFGSANYALYSTSSSALVAGTLPVAAGGTGQTTANAAFNALAPSQTSNTGKYLTTDGTDTSWATVTQTTFSAGTTGFTPNTATSGTVTLAGTLNVANGGTGVTTSTGTGNTVLSASPTFTGTVVAPTIDAGVATALTLQSAGTTAVTIDTSQNVGIGTTSPATKLVIEGGTSTDQFRLGTGSNYYQIGRESVTTGYLNFYGTQSGANGYVFGGINGERMRIDSSGNVGIGTSSPANVLQVAKNQTADTAIVVSNAGTANAATTMSFVLAESTTPQGWFRRYRDGTGITEIGYTDILTFSGNVDTTKTERMRITSAGGISFGSSGTAYGTSGQILQSNGNAAPTWVTPGGVTSITGTANQVIASASTGAVTLSTPQSIGTASSVQFGSFGVGTAASGTTGEIRATNNVTAFFSDARLKDFKGTIPNALDKVLALNGYYFTENARAKELGYNNDKMQVGVSAQEVEAVMPEVVTDAPINANFEGADYKTVYYDKLVPLLIEAIKELKAEVDELKKGK